MRRSMLMLGLGCGLLAGCAGGSMPDTGDLYGSLRGNELTLAARSVQQALETKPDGERVAWTSGRTGWSGAVRPLRTYITSGGYFCRTYEEELRKDTRNERFEHDACRSDKGAWIWL